MRPWICLWDVFLHLLTKCWFFSYLNTICFQYIHKVLKLHSPISIAVSLVKDFIESFFSLSCIILLDHAHPSHSKNILVSTKAQLGFSMPLFLASPTLTIGLSSRPLPSLARFIAIHFLSSDFIYICNKDNLTWCLYDVVVLLEIACLLPVLSSTSVGLVMVM